MRPPASACVLTLLLFLTVGGCGGGGSLPSAGGTRTQILLQSDSGDRVGAALSYSYTQANAKISVNAAGGRLTIGVEGDRSWQGDFQMPSGLVQLTPGTYTSAASDPYISFGNVALSWGPSYCSTYSGTFTIDRVTYLAGNLTEIDLRFEEHCDGAVPALHGQIHWDATDQTAPPGPVYPPPKGLWDAPAYAIPAGGDYVYLQSDPSDTAGGGKTYTLTPANTRACFTNFAGNLDVGMVDDEHHITWTGSFHGTNGKLAPGYYGPLQGASSLNPVVPAFGFGIQTATCDNPIGWFVVDYLDPSGDPSMGIDIRFEQHCGNGYPALRGKIHFHGQFFCGPG